MLSWPFLIFVQSLCGETFLEEVQVRNVLTAREGLRLAWRHVGSLSDPSLCFCTIFRIGLNMF